MLIQVQDNKVIQQLKNVLKQDIHNCLYIYIDITHYGLDNPNMKVWTSRDAEGALDFVVMKYHDSFQVYAMDPARDVKDVLELIVEFHPARISGQKEVIERLEAVLTDKYKSTYGVILCRKKEQIYAIPEEKRCTFAEIKDIPEVVDLLLTEKEFSEQYSKEELVEQLAERLCTSMGRSMVICEDGKMVGHMGTFAETDTFVVVSGAVVRKEFRRTGHFDILATEFYYQICREEKKDAYFFSTNRRQINAFKNWFEISALYGKLTKID